MQTTVDISGRDVNIFLSDRARAALAKRTAPLIVEMELYFSCLIRKKVRFHDSVHDLSVVQALDKLQIAFHPVMTENCGNDYEGDEPPLTDFPIQKPESFIPHWLKIDYQNDQWQGDFGFGNSTR